MRFDEVADIASIDARSGALTVRLAERDPRWCRLQVVSSCGVRVLGSDHFMVVMAGLGAAADDDLTALPTREIECGEWRHALVLADPEAEVYAADRGGMRELLLVVRGEIVERVALDDYERGVWRNRVSSALVRRQRPARPREVRWPGNGRYSRPRAKATDGSGS